MAFGADLTQRADCPFCGQPLNRPRTPAARRPGEMPVGACSCGAVYAFDVTGHNLGAAFVEALVFACNLDWDLAWGLVPEDDYEERIIENYDDETNLLVPGGALAGRAVRGALYFVRLHDDVREVTADGVRSRAERARKAPPPAPAGDRTFTAGEVADMVGAYRLAPLLEGTARPRALVRDLQRLLYSGDELLRLRAAETLGRLAAATADRDPDLFAGILRRLLSALEDPGAFGPGTFDAAGEIIARAPRAYAGFIPALVRYLDDPVHRPGVLRALARIAGANPALVRQQYARLLPFLQDPAPEVRGHAALVLGRLGAREASPALAGLLNDDREIGIYEDGRLRQETVGRLAAGVLATL